MVVEASFARPKDKRPHPTAPELVGGLDLSSRALRGGEARRVAELLDTADYWLSFELASFEAILARAPSPLRELGVGIVLRYGEGLDGRLAADDLERARADLVVGLSAELAAGVSAGVDTLGRAVAARARIAELEAEGYVRYAPTSGLSIHGLRAGGTAHILVDERKAERDVGLALGQPQALKATDDRGRVLAPPEIESETGAPIWARPLPEKGGDSRTVVVVVPGRYRVRVPGRAEAVRTLLAR